MYFVRMANTRVMGVQLFVLVVLRATVVTASQAQRPASHAHTGSTQLAAPERVLCALLELSRRVGVGRQVAFHVRPALTVLMVCMSLVKLS